MNTDGRLWARDTLLVGAGGEGGSPQRFFAPLTVLSFGKINQAAGFTFDAAHTIGEDITSRSRTPNALRAIVTLTTVGYGDLSPRTPFGQILASIVMVIGYGIIAVPTGIVSVELAQATRQLKISRQACPSCGAEGHDPDALHCKYCGANL